MMSLHIGDDLGEHPHVVDTVAGACPIQIAGDTFADELAPARTRQGSEVRIGQMSKKKFHAANSLLPRRVKRRRREYPEQIQCRHQD